MTKLLEMLRSERKIFLFSQGMYQQRLALWELPR